MAAPAQPNPALVIRTIDSVITIFSVPFKRGGMIAFGGRSAAIVLQSTTPPSTFLLPSTPLDPETLATLQKLPPVSHIAAFDAEHNIYLKDYALAFPHAKLYLPKPIADKWDETAHGKVTHVFGDPHAPDPFPATTNGEIESVDFGTSFQNQDIAFLHKPTKTLIEADLLFNLPGNEQFSKSNESASSFLATKALRPGTWAHKTMLFRMLAKDKAVMGHCAKRVNDWDFNRIIPCHGDVIETGAKQAWSSTYEWFLKK